MPIEQIRVLSLFILCAVTGSLITGEFSILQALLYLALFLPLWTALDMDRIRNWMIWRVLIYVSFIQFIASRIMGFYFETALFILIFISITYEVYGERRNITPIRLLSVLGFLFMVAQSRQNAGILAFVSLVLYLLGLIFCVYCFHNRIFPLHGAYLDFFKRARRSVIHMPLLIVASFLLFWALPRPPTEGNPLMGSKAAEYISGFSDSVSLTDIGILKISNKHILNITPLDGILHNNYLKGKVYNYYNKGNWQSFTTSINQYFPSSKKFQRQVAPNAALYSYRIDLDPLQNPILFFSNELVSLDCKQESYKLESIGQEIYQVARWRMLPSAFSYSFTSAELGGTLFSGGDERENLQLPSQQHYLEEYCANVLGKELYPNRAAIAERLKAHFRENFGYSLEINMNNEKDPIRTFLFQRKEGHCELFASSMALLLRSQGIPARLVTGFMIQDSDPHKAFYAVTEASAHAWVEYLNEDQRWVILDPTPPSFLPHPSFIEASRQQLNWLWQSYVILWDYDLQLNFYKKSVASVLETYQDVRQEPTGWILIALGISAAWLIFPYVVRYFWPLNALQKAMMQLEQVLAAAYGHCPVQVPQLNYLKSVRDLPEKERLVLERFYQSYWRFRFGMTPSELILRKQRARQLLGEARHLIRQYRFVQTRRAAKMPSPIAAG